MGVLVIGLDGLEPALLDRWRDELPNLSEIERSGCIGVLESTVPPITCPAWISAFSGMNPGRFGLYDFRYRRKGSYTDFGIVNSRIVAVEQLWDIASSKGLRSCVLFVPHEYPPRSIDGIMVSGFLVPDPSKDFTYPMEVRKEILELVGGPDKFILDVYDRKGGDPSEISSKLVEMTEQHFSIAKRLLFRENWDIFVFILMSPDRAHHMLWRFLEDREELILDVYRAIDRELEDLVRLVESGSGYDLVILSDHGARGMRSRLNLNDLLAKEGFLKLRDIPKKPLNLQEADSKNLIKWDESLAYSIGAYVGQIFLNLEGREPRGFLREGSEEMERVIEDIESLLRDLRSEDGRRMRVEIFRKDEVYTGKFSSQMPDLTVYLDDLSCGVNERIGNQDLFSKAGTGFSDDASHNRYCYLCLLSEKIGKSRLKRGRLEDFLPTILDLIELEHHGRFDGRSLIQ